MHLDKNNLYSYAMAKSLPTGGFKILNLAKFNLNKYDDNSSRGSINYTNYHPLDPDKSEIKREMLPDYQLKIPDKYQISIGSVKKLVPKSLGEEKYVLHFNNWQVYLRLELKIKKCIVSYNLVKQNG